MGTPIAAFLGVNSLFFFSYEKFFGYGHIFHICAYYSLLITKLHLSVRAAQGSMEGVNNKNHGLREIKFESGHRVLSGADVLLFQ